MRTASDDFRPLFQRLLDLAESHDERLARLEAGQSRHGQNLARQYDHLVHQGELLVRQGEQLTKLGEQLSGVGSQMSQLGGQLTRLEDGQKKNAEQLVEQKESLTKQLSQHRESLVKQVDTHRKIQRAVTQMAVPPTAPAKAKPARDEREATPAGRDRRPTASSAAQPDTLAASRENRRLARDIRRENRRENRRAAELLTADDDASRELDMVQGEVSQLGAQISGLLARLDGLSKSALR
ncbi:hypothetical protein WCLP8_2740008 [uncultured Gammaproteobacteria bacterium]